MSCRKQITALTLLILSYIGSVNSFTHHRISIFNLSSQFHDGASLKKTRHQGKSQNDDNEKSNDDKIEESKGFLSLPPIGESSFDPAACIGKSEQINGSTKSITLGESKSTEVGLVGSAKFELQYTCNVCETRNTHKVSRLAYTKGVVITVCKGCMSKHLIADNLGWSKHWGDSGFDGMANIEEYMDDIGKGHEVNRVSKDVFDLEQVLDLGENNQKTLISDEDNTFQ